MTKGKYKFEWTNKEIKTEKEFVERINSISMKSNEEEFETVARLWFRDDDGQKPIMIELVAPNKSTTDDEPCWLDAYIVEDMEDNNHENYCDSTSVPNITFEEVKEDMLEYAKRVYFGM